MRRIGRFVWEVASMAAITAALMGLALWLGRWLVPNPGDVIVSVVNMDPSGDTLAMAVPVALIVIVSFALWVAQAVLRRAWRRSGVAR